MTSYFISDLHLGHERVLGFDKRPFASIQEHDAHLTQSCADLGKPGRQLWILGDVAFRSNHLRDFMSVVKPRWGAVHLIRGNHDDRVAWQMRNLFDSAHEALYVRIDKQTKVYMSHYAHRVWRNSHHGSYHVHGHSHGALPRHDRSMDVGANCIGYAPISMDRVVEELSHSETVNHH